MSELKAYTVIPVAFAGLVLLILIGKLVVDFCRIKKSSGTKNAVTTYGRAAFKAGLVLVSFFLLVLAVMAGKELGKTIANWFSR